MIHKVTEARGLGVTTRLDSVHVCEDAAMEPMKPMKPMKALEPVRKGSDAAKTWWPHELGTPSVSGSSNDLRYAYFADKHRLAVDDGQQVNVYNTGPKAISGLVPKGRRVPRLRVLLTARRREGHHSR